MLEQVEGVENGHCKILDTPYAALGGIKPPRLHKADDGGIRRISVQPNQLLYLDPDAYPLDISVSDYEI